MVNSERCQYNPEHGSQLPSWTVLSISGTKLDLFRQISSLLWLLRLPFKKQHSLKMYILVKFYRFGHNLAEKGSKAAFLGMQVRLFFSLVALFTMLPFCTVLSNAHIFCTTVTSYIFSTKTGPSFRHVTTFFLIISKLLINNFWKYYFYIRINWQL